MSSGSQSGGPFTRLPVTDLTTAAAAISDLYDKLNVVAQKLGSPAPAAPATSSEPSAPGTRTVQLSAMLLPTDQVLNFQVQSNSSAILPKSSSVDQKEFTIRNSSSSGPGITLTLASPFLELVNSAAASAIVLNPGDSITIQSSAGQWRIISRS